MMASGKLDMCPMVSARMNLDDAKSAFKRLESREDAKIILHPNQGKRGDCLREAAFVHH
jgi:threonine dehydrogenase-like Zn-dependent dehydrogenase